MLVIKIRQVKNRIGAPADQERTLDVLGFHELSRVIEYECTPSIPRMADKIKHLVIIAK